MKPPRKKRSVQPERSYPPFWERAVPIMVAVIVLVIAGLLIVALLVALGVFPGSA